MTKEEILDFHVHVFEGPKSYEAYPSIDGLTLTESLYNAMSEYANQCTAPLEARIRELEDGWVRVEDRLPELPKPFTIDGNTFTPVISKCIVYDGEYVYEKSYDKKGFHDDSITHWRELPKPPNTI